MNKLSYIAIYLPQFHEIEENNKWWGKGFTEWTNTKKAKPLYENHYQPRVPINQEYYDLSTTEHMIKQAEIAKSYGVSAFCYYHYWFKGGKKLLEKPLDNMLNDHNVDIPFILSWANEPWSRRWDGSSREVLMEQDYGDKDDWEKHFLYLLPFFLDKRYLLEKNKPIFVIYKADEIPNLNEMTNYLENRAIESGFDGIEFIFQFPSYYYSKKDNSTIQTGIHFEPIFTLTQTYRPSYLLKNFFVQPKSTLKILINRINVKLNKGGHINLINYDDIWNVILNRNASSFNNFYPGAFVDWDNTARRGNKAVVFRGSTPEKFGEYLDKLSNKAIKEYKKDKIFINAWNEWAEGAHLEPDEKHGYAYLEQVKKCYDKYNGGN